MGSIYYDLFHKREPEAARAYVVEGIGHDFMVGTLDFSVIDEICTRNDDLGAVSLEHVDLFFAHFVGDSEHTTITPNGRRHRQVSQHQSRS